MVPYDAGDHFEQIFLLYFDAGSRSLLIGDRLENCWLATSNSCINSKKHLILSEVIPRKRQRRKRRYLRSVRLSKSYVSPWYKIQAMWTNCSAKISFFPPKCDSAIGQHFHKNQDCDAAYDDKQFTVKAVARFSFYQVTLEATFMKNKQPTLFRQ